MSTSTAPAARNGLLNVADIVVAPGAAFARIREVPVWAVAFLVATILTAAGLLLMQPAQLHALETSGPAMYAATDAIKRLPADQQQAMIGKMMSFGRTGLQLAWILSPLLVLLGALIQSVIMLIGNAIGKGDGTFKRYWSLALHTAVVTSLGVLLAGLIATLRGPGAFETTASVQTAVPSLALLAPGVTGKGAAFLATLNVTSIWAAVLAALGMIAVGRVARPVAYATAAVSLLIGAGFAAAFAQG